MANIIDSLYIALGLDVSQFNKGKQEALDGLKKVDSESEKVTERSNKRAKSDDAESRKRAEENKKRTKDQGKALEDLTGSIAKFGSALVAVGLVKEFITNQVQTNAQLGRTSQLLGTSARELDAWGAAAKTTGGDSTAFVGAIQGIQEGLAKIAIGKGGEEIVKTLAQLGVQAKGGKVDLLELGDALKRVRAERGELTAKAFANSLGFDDNGYLLLTKSRAELTALIAQMSEFSGKSDEVTKGSERLQSAWAKLSQSTSGTLSKTFEHLVPILETTLNLITKIATFANKGDLGGAALNTIPGYKLASMLAGNGDGSKPITNPSADKKLSHDPKSIIEYFKSKGWSEAQAKGIAANVMRESKGDPNAVGDNGQAYGVAQWHPDRQAMFKNVMGGDIKGSSFEKQLAFIDWELKNSESQAGNYLKRANDPGAAAKVVSMFYERPAATYQEANQRAALANSFQTGDGSGGNGGGPSIQTNINTINVQTNATDANGVANGMRDALSNNQLVNAGIGGAR